MTTDISGEQEGKRVTTSNPLAVNLVSGDITQTSWVAGLGADVDDDNYYYKGFIKVGSTKWRIQRIDNSTFEITWAAGDNNGATAWDNRTSLTYSTTLGN